MILIVDNQDSFVHNLARYIRQLGSETRVVRRDDPQLLEIGEWRLRGLVISPGPGGPGDSERVLGLVREYCDRLPILGVCLGHQVIVQAFGGRVSRGLGPMHGRTSLVHHDGHRMFRGIPTPWTVCRYHSLTAVGEELPDGLNISAWTDQGEVMAIAHDELPIWGVQFHPEAILTQHGYRLLANWLELADGQFQHRAVDQLQSALTSEQLQALETDFGEGASEQDPEVERLPAGRRVRRVSPARHG